MLISANMYAGVYCNNRVISVGDTSYDIYMKCGEPDFIERSEPREMIYQYGPVWEKISIDKEFWYYQKPNSLLRIFEIRNNKLYKIEQRNP